MWVISKVDETLCQAEEWNLLCRSAVNVLMFECIGCLLQPLIYPYIKKKKKKKAAE